MIRNFASSFANFHYFSDMCKGELANTKLNGGLLRRVVATAAAISERRQYDFGST